MPRKLGHGAKYSKAEVLAFKRLFEEADRDHNGYVAPQEVINILQQQKDQGLGVFVNHLQVMRVIDVNKDGKLTLDEMLRVFFPLATAKEFKIMLKWAGPPRVDGPEPEPTFVPNPHQLDELKRMFIMYDKNQNGALDLAELREAMSCCGYDPKEVEQLFIASDKDEDSNLSFDEFVQLMRDSYV